MLSDSLYKANNSSMIEAVSSHRFLLKINASGAEIPSSDTSTGVHMGHADVKNPINIPTNPAFSCFLVPFFF